LMVAVLPFSLFCTKIFPWRGCWRMISSYSILLALASRRDTLWLRCGSRRTTMVRI